MSKQTGGYPNEPLSDSQSLESDDFLGLNWWLKGFNLPIIFLLNNLT
ncbi:hypothetical protein ACED98_01380 [Streptococcus thoraltensis]